MTFDNYIQSLPSIEEDSEFWKHCSPCAQGDSKVPYRECGECKHLNPALVRQYIAHEESLWEDLDLEAEQARDYNDCMKGTFSDRYVLYDGHDDDYAECEKNYLGE